VTAFRRLAGHPDAAALAPAVLPLIHEAGSPYFDWLLGGPSAARAALGSLLERPTSEIAPSNVTLLMDGDRVLGVYVALGGAELARCRTADGLALLQGAGSRESRVALSRRLAEARDLFPPVHEHDFYLSKIAVIRDQQRVGYGRALLERYVAEGVARGFARFRLDVSAGNPAALGLYRSAGFEPVTEREAGGLRYLAMAAEEGRLRSGGLRRSMVGAE
jgi:ribosomal protein S18 acetylase RimI-like enzyme